MEYLKNIWETAKGLSKGDSLGESLLVAIGCRLYEFNDKINRENRVNVPPMRVIRRSMEIAANIANSYEEGMDLAYQIIYEALMSLKPRGGSMGGSGVPHGKFGSANLEYAKSDFDTQRRRGLPSMSELRKIVAYGHYNPGDGKVPRKIPTSRQLSDARTPRQRWHPGPNEGD